MSSKCWKNHHDLKPQNMHDFLENLWVSTWKKEMFHSLWHFSLALHRISIYSHLYLATVLRAEWNAKSFHTRQVIFSQWEVRIVLNTISHHKMGLLTARGYRCHLTHYAVQSTFACTCNNSEQMYTLPVHHGLAIWPFTEQLSKTSKQPVAIDSQIRLGV